MERLDTSSDSVDTKHLLVSPAPESELEWSDFEHLGQSRDHVEDVLRAGLWKDAPGMNILLYGPPGTRKTEFCKVLARQLGATLYSVGEADEDGDEPSRQDRLGEFKLTQHLLAKDGGSLLLFDEMEDLLPGYSRGFSLFGQHFSSCEGKGGSKVFIHRLLEESPTPTLWTMNDIWAAPEAVLRRMSVVLELRPPTTAVRTRIWERLLSRRGIEAGADEASSLAREFDVHPGVMNGVVVAAQLCGGNVEAVRHGAYSLARALSRQRPPQGAPPLFDPALIRADIDPGMLAGRLRRSGGRRFSLCLQGPPGTGKSAYVRYLAEDMGLEVMQKRSSDLMSMWVGETERKIADAFEEARDAGAFLVFDEADSLLADRGSAHRNWEVRQVNEMLTWMENHPFPFACTTNFGAHLDAASLRRFTFKITLGYLLPGQVEGAFRRYFALTPPARLARLATLTPGDFAVVRSKAGILGRLDDPEALADMLFEECRSKPGGGCAIGF